MDKFNADIIYKIQDSDHCQMGIASALKLSKNFTNGDNFAVILGDNFYSNNFKNEVNNFNSKCKLFIKQVSDVTRFGCASVKGNKITKIVEKPTNPESDLAVTGLYFYSPEIYEVLPNLKILARKELEITDLNNYFVQQNTAQFSLIEGFWSDMGTPDSMVRTQKYVRDNDFGTSF